VPMLAGGEIRNVCVIGAGTMGSGIAAHLANLGFKVSLLDLTPESVQEAFSRARQAKPPHFFVPDTANHIRLGSIGDNPDWIAEADWVCEAIIERPDAKRALYQTIEPILRPDAMISTNTSGLQIEMLAEGLSDSFRARFLGTHFFNPPRYLKLLELIPTSATSPEIVDGMTRFLEEYVARRVVLAKDTPGFIANRFGMWSMFKAIHVAERLGLSIEEVDVITGPFLGRPRSGSFRLNDIVGLDVMRDIATNLIERCTSDPHIKVLEQPASMHSLLARGWIGDKAGQGYYRKEGKELLALDLHTFAYRNRQDVAFPSIESLGDAPLGERIGMALEFRDQVGDFLRNYLVPTLQYANYLKDEVSHSVQDFDRVMEWGFGWEKGPFAIIDALGHERLGIQPKPFYIAGATLGSKGYVAVREEPEYRKLDEYPVVKEGASYRMRDLGDGIMAIALTTKMGVIGPGVVAELSGLLETITLTRFVLTSEARSFSAGFDLKFLLACIEAQQWNDIDESLQALQHLGELLERSQAVAAVHGHCFGAGLELALSCAHIVAASDAQIGLPESRVGLLPGGRGTVLMRMNNQASPRRLTEAALTLTKGLTSINADQARQLGYLRPADLTVYHPDRLITDAKLIALRATDVDRPVWNTEPSPLMGMIDREFEQAQQRGDMTEYDLTIGQKIKHVFVKSAGYADGLVKERVEFIDLCARTMSLARLRHMVENGKPLRN
jgi:3-hydroxyacyl-CoA dehydrogenase